MKKFGYIVVIIATVMAYVPTCLAENYNWKIVSFLRAGKTFNQEIKKFAEIVTKETAGAVEFTIYEGTLGAPTDGWEMTKKNVTQFFYTGNSFNANRLPVMNIVDLPFEFTDPMSVKLVVDAWMKAGYLREVTDHFKVLWIMPTNPLHAFFKKKEITTLEGWRSVKIRTPSGAGAQIINALGGSSISMPGSESYMALSTGVIEGLISSIDSVHDRKLYEVVDYGIKSPPISYGMLMFMMNKDIWNSLPNSIQTAIDNAAELVAAEAIDRTQNGLGPFWDIVSKNLKNVYNISKEEAARWKNATAKVSDEYLQNHSSSEYQVKEAYQLMQKIVEDYQSK